MPVNVTTQTAAKNSGTQQTTPAVAPPRPEKVDLILRGCERFDFERQLYVRNVIYTFAYNKAVQMLRLKDDQERPRFVRYVPGQNHRKIMVEVPKTVDMSAKVVTPPPVSTAPPETPAKIIAAGDDSELADIDGLHSSADGAGEADDTPPEEGIEV